MRLFFVQMINLSIFKNIRFNHVTQSSKGIIEKVKVTFFF